jgi:hypothetical protein
MIEKVSKEDLYKGQRCFDSDDGLSRICNFVVRNFMRIRANDGGYIAFPIPFGSKKAKAPNDINHSELSA